MSESEGSSTSSVCTKLIHMNVGENDKLLNDIEDVLRSSEREVDNSDFVDNTSDVSDSLLNETDNIIADINDAAKKLHDLEVENDIPKQRLNDVGKLLEYSAARVPANKRKKVHVCIEKFKNNEGKFDIDPIFAYFFL